MITPDVVEPHCIAEGCQERPLARSLCGTHYRRAKWAGNLPPRISAVDRLTRRLIRQPNGCLEWQGTRERKMGYGAIFVNGKSIKTHRFAWELSHGPVPEGLFVLHRCDNPPCCNVDHLWLGALAENNADRAAKGRNGNRWAS